MERLTFNIGSSRGGPLVVAGAAEGRRAHARPADAVDRGASPRSASATTGTTCGCSRSRRCSSSGRRIRFPASELLHLSELTAIAGLAAMAVRRMSAGQTIAHANAEVVGVVVLGAIIVLTTAVLDLAGRLGERVQRHLRQDHPDLRADDEHDHLAAPGAADDLGHDHRLRLHRRARGLRLRPRRQPRRGRPRAAAPSAGCSRTRTTSR